MAESSKGKCAGCGGKTVAAEIGFPPKLRPSDSEGVTTNFAGVPVSVRVCTVCGRVELFTSDPESFK